MAKDIEDLMLAVIDSPKPEKLEALKSAVAAKADEETAGVAANLKASGAFSTMSALSFMIFNLLCAPCFAACGAIRREMNSARWTGFAIAYMCLWAYVVAFLVYQLGLWITEGTFASAQVLACALTLGLLYMAVRRNPHEKENN